MSLIQETMDRPEPLPAGVDLHVAGERTEYCFGLDLGQKRDYTALALVERSEVVYRERSAVTYKRFEKVEYRLRFLERLELGLPFPDVIAPVDEVVTALRRSRGA